MSGDTFISVRSPYGLTSGNLGYIYSNNNDNNNKINNKNNSNNNSNKNNNVSSNQ
jgi:hypothetical protein